MLIIDIIHHKRAKVPYYSIEAINHNGRKLLITNEKFNTYDEAYTRYEQIRKKYF